MFEVMNSVFIGDIFKFNLANICPIFLFHFSILYSVYGVFWRISAYLYTGVITFTLNFNLF